MRSLIEIYLSKEKPAIWDLKFLCEKIGLSFDKHYIGTKTILTVEGFEAKSKKQALLIINNIYTFLGRK